jgi:hypothetical protein
MNLFNNLFSEVHHIRVLTDNIYKKLFKLNSLLLTGYIELPKMRHV